MPQRAWGRIALVVIGLLVVAACDKVTPENLDKWMDTENGPKKLLKALGDPSIDPDLSAHAAVNLIKINQENDVVAAINAMGDDRRHAVVAKLAPRLWEMARIEGDMAIPSPLQTVAKDLMFDLRKGADPATRQQLDGYLMDWYTTGYYKARATVGMHLGATVMRSLGPAAGQKLEHAANAVITQPAQGKAHVKVDDEILLGMAASGDPDAVKYILDLSKRDLGDKTLRARCIAALEQAYVQPNGVFDVVPPDALAANMDAIAQIANDETLEPGVTNDAVALIKAVGMPKCLDPLVAMIRSTNRERRWTGTDNALRCGGVKAIGPVVGALPTDTGYEQRDISGAVFEDIAKLQPRDQVLAEVRPLLDSPSWVARWTAVEVLALMKSKEDVPRLQKLTSDKTKLTGYRGDQSDADPKAKKPDPTLGERTTELLKTLQGA